MPRYIYINGRYCLPHEAKVSFQDRGFQFGDGIYIVIAYYQGHFVDERAHLDHLESYCQSIHLGLPMSREGMRCILRETVRRNRLQDASIYVQVTRGDAKRVHWFPDDAKPTLVVVASPWRFETDPEKTICVNVVSSKDIRWRRTDIKTTSLLPTVLLRQHAKLQGAFETWLLDDSGYISEGASSNAYIVTSKGVLVTRPSDGTLIPGVTRARLLKIAQDLGFTVEERAFSLTEAYDAAEAFLSGATSTVKAVTHLDGRPIGQGCLGPMTKILAKYYFNFFRHGE